MMEQLKHRSQYCTTNNQDQTGPRERTGSWSGIVLENVARARNTTTAEHVEESELELTLSIGMSSSSMNKDMDYSSTTSFRSSSDNCNNQSNNINCNNQESSGPTTPMSSSSTTSLDREKKRPHWLFQGLSINRTSWFLLIHWLFLFPSSTSSWFSSFVSYLLLLLSTRFTDTCISSNYFFLIVTKKSKTHWQNKPSSIYLSLLQSKNLNM